MLRRDDYYSRMEEQLRGRGRRRPLRMIALEAVVLVGFVFLLGYLLYAAQFSGGVRWALGFVLIAALSAYAWANVARRTSDPRPLIRPPPAAHVRTGELTALAATIRRADAGLTYSQVSVSAKARDAFAEHLRLVWGLSPEAMRRFQADPLALRRAFRDPLLEDFLFLATPDSDERYRWVERARRMGGFPIAFNEVLNRMEAWR